jgi:hypothetical protein
MKSTNGRKVLLQLSSPILFKSRRTIFCEGFHFKKNPLLDDSAWWESNEELPKSKFKKFVRTSLAVLKKVAMILPLSRLKFFVCCNQKISASAVAKV